VVPERKIRLRFRRKMSEREKRAEMFFSAPFFAQANCNGGISGRQGRRLRRSFTLDGQISIKKPTHTGELRGWVSRCIITA